MKLFVYNEDHLYNEKIFEELSNNFKSTINVVPAKYTALQSMLNVEETIPGLDAEPIIYNDTQMYNDFFEKPEDTFSFKAYINIREPEDDPSLLQTHINVSPIESETIGTNLKIGVKLQEKIQSFFNIDDVDDSKLGTFFEVSKDAQIQLPNFLRVAQSDLDKALLSKLRVSVSEEALLALNLVVGESVQNNSIATSTRIFGEEYKSLRSQFYVDSKSQNYIANQITVFNSIETGIRSFFHVEETSLSEPIITNIRTKVVQFEVLHTELFVNERYQTTIPLNLHVEESIGENILPAKLYVRETSPQGDGNDAVFASYINIALILQLKIVEFLGVNDLKDVRIRLYKENHDSMYLDSTHQLLLDSNFDSPAAVPFKAKEGHYLLQIWHPQYELKEFVFGIRSGVDIEGGLTIEMRKLGVYKMGI